jgi:hypothetical protein
MSSLQELDDAPVRSLAACMGHDSDAGTAFEASSQSSGSVSEYGMDSVDSMEVGRVRWAYGCPERSHLWLGPWSFLSPPPPLARSCLTARPSPAYPLTPPPFSVLFCRTQAEAVAALLELHEQPALAAEACPSGFPNGERAALRAHWPPECAAPCCLLIVPASPLARHIP